MIRRTPRALCSMGVSRLVLPVLLVLATNARAADLELGVDCGPTIQDCIDRARDGDRVLIGTGSCNESLLLERAVSLVGLGRDPADTVISASRLANRPLLIRGKVVDRALEIGNLTFQDGVVTSTEPILRDGGGILVMDGARPTIHDVDIRNKPHRFRGRWTVSGRGQPARSCQRPLHR